MIPRHVQIIVTEKNVSFHKEGEVPRFIEKVQNIP